MKLTIIGLLLIGVIVGGLIIGQKGKNLTDGQIQEKPALVSQVSPTSINSPGNIAPLPTEEDIIRTFFNLIDEDRPAEAISMMTPQLTGDDSTKQTWGVHFNAIDQISVNSIEPSMKEEWTNGTHTYKVTLDVLMKPEAANAPIPNYGWENGPNVRWISIIKIDNLWKISSIATGP